MRHARSVQLIPEQADDETRSLAIDDLRQWERLGGKCIACQHEGWINKYALRQRYGRRRLAHLEPLLRCQPCGNKGDNSFIVGMMARD